MCTARLQTQEKSLNNNGNDTVQQNFTFLSVLQKNESNINTNCRGLKTKEHSTFFYVSLRDMELLEKWEIYKKGTSSTLYSYNTVSAHVSWAFY